MCGGHQPHRTRRCWSRAVEELGFAQYGSAKLNDLTRFLESRSARYRVDTRFNDMFG